MMESKLLVGGKSIVDKTTEQERALEQRRHEIAEQKVTPVTSYTKASQSQPKDSGHSQKKVPSSFSNLQNNIGRGYGGKGSHCPTLLVGLRANRFLIIDGSLIPQNFSKFNICGFTQHIFQSKSKCALHILKYIFLFLLLSLILHFSERKEKCSRNWRKRMTTRLRLRRPTPPFSRKWNSRPRN